MKKWLIRNFLPQWAKETVLQENKQLRLENRELDQRLRELEQYINGIHVGLRGRRSN